MQIPKQNRGARNSEKRLLVALKYAPRINGYTMEQWADILQLSKRKTKEVLDGHVAEGKLQCIDYDGVKVYGRAKERSLDELIEAALAAAPRIKGYTVKQLENITEYPWPTTRWQARWISDSTVYKLSPKKKNVTS